MGWQLSRMLPTVLSLDDRVGAGSVEIDFSQRWLAVSTATLPGAIGRVGKLFCTFCAAGVARVARQYRSRRAVLPAIRQPC